MNPAVIGILVSLFLLAGMLLFSEIGFRLGKSGRFPNLSVANQGILTVDAAVFGLLGLTLAFTFAGASERLATRRSQIVQEANAIGTAYLRIDLLPVDDQPAIRDLYRKYLDLRVEVFAKFLDRPVSNAALAESGQVQREIWSRSVASCSRGRGRCSRSARRDNRRQQGWVQDRECHEREVACLRLARRLIYGQ